MIADPNPKWTAGLNAQLRVGKFQFSTLFDMRHGGQVWDGTRGALDRFGTAEETEVRTSTAGRLRPERAAERARRRSGRRHRSAFSDRAAIGRAGSPVCGGSAGSVQSQFVEDGSFVKWRELSVALHARQRVGARTASASAAH